MVVGLFFSIKADAGTINEGKNKKYVYKYLSDLKTIIKTDDPTDFKELKFIRKSANKEFFATPGLGHGEKVGKKRKSYEYDAFVFHAIYNSGHKIIFLVDIDYVKNLEKAKKHVVRLSLIHI